MNNKNKESPIYRIKDKNNEGSTFIDSISKKNVRNTNSNNQKLVLDPVTDSDDEIINKPKHTLILKDETDLNDNKIQNQINNNESNDNKNTKLASSLIQPHPSKPHTKADKLRNRPLFSMIPKSKITPKPDESNSEENVTKIDTIPLNTKSPFLLQKVSPLQAKKSPFKKLSPKTNPSTEMLLPSSSIPVNTSINRHIVSLDDIDNTASKVKAISAQGRTLLVKRKSSNTSEESLKKQKIEDIKKSKIEDMKVKEEILNSNDNNNTNELNNKKIESIKVKTEIQNDTNIKEKSSEISNINKFSPKQSMEFSPLNTPPGYGLKRKISDSFTLDERKNGSNDELDLLNQDYSNNSELSPESPSLDPSTDIFLQSPFFTGNVNHLSTHFQDLTPSSNNVIQPDETITEKNRRLSFDLKETHINQEPHLVTRQKDLLKSLMKKKVNTSSLTLHAMNQSPQLPQMLPPNNLSNNNLSLDDYNNGISLSYEGSDELLTNSSLNNSSITPDSNTKSFDFNSDLFNINLSPELSDKTYLNKNSDGNTTNISPSNKMINLSLIVSPFTESKYEPTNEIKNDDTESKIILTEDNKMIITDKDIQSLEEKESNIDKNKNEIEIKKTESLNNTIPIDINRN